MGVVVPVNNEEHALRQCLDALCAAASDVTVPVTIIVVLDACTDADAAGCRYAMHLKEMAASAGVDYARSVPPDGLNDWNNVIEPRRVAA